MARGEGIRGVIGFVETVAAGSFAGAAKKLGVTPVAVSKNVQRVERQLDVRLLQRSTRKLSLTAEGRLFYDRCSGPLRELQGAQAAVSERSRAPVGTLRVTCLQPFGRAFVVPLLAGFSRRYPGIQVQLDLSDTTRDMIAKGFHVAIRAGLPRGSSMVAREIAPLHFVVCGAPAYLAVHGVPQDPADLQRHNCLRMVRSGPDATGWTLGAGKRFVEVKGNLVAGDFVTLAALAQQGLGLAHLPLPLVLPAFRDGKLVPVLADWVSQPTRLYLCYPNRKGLPARVLSLVGFMLEELHANADLRADPRTLLAPFGRAPD
jgi:DNA-binding transcriptional LysR family regulator